MIDLETFTNKLASHSANLVVWHDSVADMYNFCQATKSRLGQDLLAAAQRAYKFFEDEKETSK